MLFTTQLHVLAKIVFSFHPKSAFRALLFISFFAAFFSVFVISLLLFDVFVVENLDGMVVTEPWRRLGYGVYAK